MSAETFLNDTWSVYFHDPDDERWDDDSYQLLCSISTMEEFVHLHRPLKECWAKGMFFVMREHIRPQWEDPHNRDGGCFSFKIMKEEVPSYWFELVSKVLGETMLNPEYRDQWDNICGVSISPKRSFCILRLWLSQQHFSDPAQYDFNAPLYTKIMFRPYTDNKDFMNALAAGDGAANSK